MMRYACCGEQRRRTEVTATTGMEPAPGARRGAVHAIADMVQAQSAAAAARPGVAAGASRGAVRAIMDLVQVSQKQQQYSQQQQQSQHHHQQQDQRRQHSKPRSQQQQHQPPHEQADLVLQVILGADPRIHRSRWILRPFHAVCRAGRAAALSTIRHLQLDWSATGKRSMGTKHLLAVLAEAHHATHLTIHTNQLDGLVASLMEQKQLGRGALIALDDPLQADLLHLGRTAPNTTAPAAEAADANGSSIRMGASTSISASHTSPAAGSSPAAATATKPRGPCYQRLTVDSPVTKASVELVMQLLDLLPGTQHLRELELGQCRMLYGLLCEHKMRTYVAPSLLHTVTQPQPGTSYGTRLGAGSSSSSSSSSSNSSSGPARGWRGSCRALVVDGFGRFGGLRATPLTLLQPLLGCMEQLQVLIGWHVDGTQSLLHTTSLTPLRALVLLETRCCGDMLASLPGLTGLRHLAMTHGDLSWAHVDGAALSALLALTSVDLSYSTTTLPAEVLSGLCSVTGLRSLDLMWTSIASLPEHATALTRLSELHWACSTGPMQLDVVWRLTSLRVLTVGDLRWAAVPGAISQLSNLQSLSVDGLSLASLPTTISALVQLQLLDVGISVIKVLPDTITALTQLKTIQGSGMQAAEQSAAVQAFLAERGVTL